jgi:hypothetical protein
MHALACWLRAQVVTCGRCGYAYDIDSYPVCPRCW